MPRPHFQQQFTLKGPDPPKRPAPELPEFYFTDFAHRGRDLARRETEWEDWSAAELYDEKQRFRRRLGEVIARLLYYKQLRKVPERANPPPHVLNRQKDYLYRLIDEITVYLQAACLAERHADHFPIDYKSWADVPLVLLKVDVCCDMCGKHLIWDRLTSKLQPVV